jgi:hypothetical protein
MFSLIKTFDFGLSDIIFSAWKVFTKKFLDMVAICLLGSLPYIIAPFLESTGIGSILSSITILAGSSLQILMVAHIVEAVASEKGASGEGICLSLCNSHLATDCSKGD